MTSREKQPLASPRLGLRGWANQVIASHFKTGGGSHGYCGPRTWLLRGRLSRRDPGRARFRPPRRLRPGATLGADKGYDTRDFIATLRARGITPHVAQHTTHRRSAIDGRTTRHAGYAVSQQKRKLVEEIFGWLKTIALLRKTRHRGVRRVG